VKGVWGGGGVKEREGASKAGCEVLCRTSDPADSKHRLRRLATLRADRLIQTLRPQCGGTQVSVSVLLRPSIKFIIPIF
jgi:hypothetical protein